VFPWADFFFLSIFDDACIRRGEGVCRCDAAGTHLQSVQLQRGLRIVVSPGVMFEDDDSIQGQKELSVLLRNVVKPEDVDDPISVGGLATPPCSSSRSHLRIVTSRGDPCTDANRKD
jgi:hypothetical protein